MPNLQLMYNLCFVVKSWLCHSLGRPPTHPPTQPAPLTLYQNTVPCTLLLKFIVNAGVSVLTCPPADQWDAPSPSQQTGWDALFGCCWCRRSKVYNEVVSRGISRTFFPPDGPLSSFGWSSRAHSWEVTQHLFRVLQARCSKMKAILWCWEWRSIDLGWSQTGRHSHKVKEKWNAKGNKSDKGSIKATFISTEKMSYIKSGRTTVILHCFDMWIWRVFI